MCLNVFLKIHNEWLLYNIMKGLFIFHRDFRIIDNKGLIEASKQCDELYTCFIFTTTQVTNNTYKSKNSIQFMIESLEDLRNDIKGENGKLMIFYGNNVSCVENVMEELKIDKLFFNEDYTPYAKIRITQMENLCKKLDVDIEYFHDYYINEPGTMTTSSGDVYKKFTPFYEKTITNNDFDVPSSYKIGNFSKTARKLKYATTLTNAMVSYVGEQNTDIMVHGGRENGLSTLKTALINMKKYAETRDDLSNETSMLSAYIKYGCISIREVTMKFKQKYGKHCEFIRQLIWRDFYMHLLNKYPESLNNLHRNNMKSITWNTNNEQLRLWKNGTTGFPLVDAGMRQLNKTGYMHNRCRMIVATFLSKILFLDWREGEKYFAQQLVDYDVASNSGNWQAVVGGGLYAMPYFRVLSPWTQSDKNDHDCEYIKKWVPELKDVENKHIHKWYKYYKKNNNVDYPKPMVDFDKQLEKYLDKMKN